MVFPYKRDLREQNVQKNKRIDNNVDFKGKPTNFRNAFVSKMKDTNKSFRREDPGTFSEEAAMNFFNTRQVLLDGYPDFVDENKQIEASYWMPKYDRSTYLPDEEKAFYTNKLQYIQDPANSNLANNIGYAGSEGVKPT